MQRAGTQYSPEEIDTAVFEIVARLELVTFSELLADLKKRVGHVAGEWNFYLRLSSGKRFIVWNKMSPAVVYSLRRLVKGRRIFLHHCSVVVYILEGTALKLPSIQFADDVRDCGAWLPMLLCTYPWKRR